MKTWLDSVPYGGHAPGPVQVPHWARGRVMYVGQGTSTATAYPNENQGANTLVWTLFGVGLGFIFAAILKTPNLFPRRTSR